MDVRQIHALIAIADHGSFSAAARAMYTVQSNVSAHISRLESELAAVLVDRSTGNLTEEGLVVLEHGRRVVRELSEISTDIAALHDVVSGDTRLGVIGTTGRWLMPQFLTRLREAYPDVKPVISEGGTSTLIPRLVAGQLDAAIVHLPVDEPDIRVEPLFAEDLVLLVHSQHPWSTASELAIESLTEHPLLLPPPSSSLGRIINRAAVAHGVELHTLAEIDGVRLLASLAFEGFGAAVVPATSVPVWLRGDFNVIHVPELPRRVVGWARRRRPEPGAPTRVAHEIVLHTIKRRAGRQPGLHLDAETLQVNA